MRTKVYAEIHLLQHYLKDRHLSKNDYDGLILVWPCNEILHQVLSKYDVRKVKTSEYKKFVLYNPSFIKEKYWHDY